MVVVWTKRNFENRFVVKKNMGCVNHNDTQLYFGVISIMLTYLLILEWFWNTLETESDAFQMNGCSI
jgi:hypothetical protein